LSKELTKESIQKLVEDLAPELKDLSEYVYQNPELGYEEFLSSKAHIELLKAHNFEVEYPYLDIQTAFRAVYKGEKEGPAIAFLSEYDALPEVGHGCGHNLLGATETGAGIILSKLVDQIGGTVVVLGTPAEEIGGAKVTMANADTFDDIDIALSTHPSDGYYASGKSMAMEAIEFRFYGKGAHAASAPFEGKNALDACINTFNNINSFRQQMKPTARVHGVIKEGGEAANVIPDYTRAEFYIRSIDLPYLNELRSRVIECAEAGALAAGCEMKWGYYEKAYKNLVTNSKLSERFNENMGAIGIEMNLDERESFGSMDMGDVSQVVPAINPYFGITAGKTVSAHTAEFRDCTLTDYAHQSMIDTITALNLTAVDVIGNPDLLEEIKGEFQENILADQ